MIKKALGAGALCCALVLGGCASGVPASGGAGETSSAVTQLPQVDMAKWNYEADADVYWQTGISYCETPADAAYENMGIFVPGAYFSASDNGDGTFTCEVNGAGTASGFTAATAPIVVPVETPGYTAMAAPEGYVATTASYTDAGFIYAFPGCRGRDAGAPAGVTDLKAAIRYLRYNEGVVPGDMDRIFSFGMSGGGGQSALLGASGDSSLYDPYLEAIGAVSGVSDAVAGSMCWCPITSLGSASEAYEWNLGVTRTDEDAQTQALSDAMAQKFAEYLNGLGLVDADGNSLELVASEDGIYQAGSYYEYLKSVVEDSLDHFLAETTFPYTVASGKGGFGGAGMADLPEGDAFDGQLPQDGFAGKGGMGAGADLGGKGAGGGRMMPDGALDGEDLPDLGEGGLPGRGGLPQLDAGAADAGADIYDLDGIERTEASGSVSLSGTYDTVQDYIDALNADGEWVSYDPATNTATITSLADFVKALKPASKTLGAFDALDDSQGENVLFGDGNGNGAHFDAMLADLVAGTEYEDAFAQDLARTDALGTPVEDIVSMYDPLYYLLPVFAGYDTSEVAPYWRIRSGINQSDTALCTEVDLALALEALGEDVDFEAVWGQAHVEAELAGTSTDNFISWVNSCCS